MLKNGKLLADYRDELIKEWGYEEALAEDISMMAESLISEYGEEYEDAILDAIKNTEYAVARERGNNNRRETIYDVLKRNDMLDTVLTGKTMIGEPELKSASSFFAMKPELSFDGERYSIKGVRRLAILPSTYNSANPDSVAKLAEISDHAIKSSLNSLEINGDELISRSGFVKKTIKLANNNGTVTSTIESEIGRGFDEGLSSYTALHVTRCDYDGNYDIQDDSSLRLVAGSLMDSLNLRSVIREAAITKDDETLRRYFDEFTDKGYDAFLREMDNLLMGDFNRKRNSVDAEAHKRALTDMDEIFTRSVAPIVNELAMQMVEKGYMEDVDQKSL